MRKGFAQNFYGAIKILGEEGELLRASASSRSKYRGVISPEREAQRRSRKDARSKRTRQEMLNTTWPDETSTLKLAAKLKALENTYARDKIAYKNVTGKEWKDIVVKQNK